MRGVSEPDRAVLDAAGHPLDVHAEAAEHPSEIIGIAAAQAAVGAPGDHKHVPSGLPVVLSAELNDTAVDPQHANHGRNETGEGELSEDYREERTRERGREELPTEPLPNVDSAPRGRVPAGYRGNHPDEHGPVSGTAAEDAPEGGIPAGEAPAAETSAPAKKPARKNSKKSADAE